MHKSFSIIKIIN